jgi:hypothetical protein
METGFCATGAAAWLFFASAQSYRLHFGHALGLATLGSHSKPHCRQVFTAEYYNY